MPIGLTLCFGPIVVVWLKQEFMSGDDKKKH